MLVKGKTIFEKTIADDLIHGIMSSHVLSENQHLTVKIENGGSMKSTGFSEDRLRRAQVLRQLKNEFLRHADWRIDRWKMFVDRFH